MSTNAPSNIPTYLLQLTSLAGTLASWMRLPVMVSSGIAVILSSALYFKQKSLIYPSNFPAESRTHVPRPSHYGLHDFEDLLIPTPDNETLHAFFIRPPNPSQAVPTTIIMFHGNAGNIGHRVPIAGILGEMTGASVLMVEYRGYGLSTGQADEKGLMVDAQTALDYILKRHETRSHRIVIYGQSLGGAVSIALVAKNQSNPRIAGLILENTFLSMRKLIPSVVPPARWISGLCHQVWGSDRVIGAVTEVPVLFLSGLRDEIVPPDHMRRLHALCGSPIKVWKPLPNGDHNSSVMEEGYFDAIKVFMQSLETRGEVRMEEKERIERDNDKEDEIWGLETEGRSR